MSKTEMASDALRRSIKTRREFKRSLDGPINPIDLAMDMGLSVRFVDVSMEGMYDGGGKPAIILSSLRPLARRMYTCGHELAHHVYGHGSRLDEIQERSTSGLFQPDEFVADAFAGFLLMPPPGLRRAFSQRNLRPAAATPLDIVRIASDFGVGYDTLITQLNAQRFFDQGIADRLRKKGLGAVRKEFLRDDEKTPLYVIDTNSEAKTIDVEVGSFVVLPDGISPTLRLEFVKSLGIGNLFRTKHVGVEQFQAGSGDWAMFMRISRLAYVGLAQFRHLEEPDEA